MLNVFVSRAGILNVTDYLSGMNIIWELQKRSANADFPHHIVVVEDGDGVPIGLIKTMLESLYWKDCVVVQ
jgi:hypothetical protein